MLPLRNTNCTPCHLTSLLLMNGKCGHRSFNCSWIICHAYRTLSTHCTFHFNLHMFRLFIIYLYYIYFIHRNIHYWSVIAPRTNYPIAYCNILKIIIFQYFENNSLGYLGWLSSQKNTFFVVGTSITYYIYLDLALHLVRFSNKIGLLDRIWDAVMV